MARRKTSPYANVKRSGKFRSEFEACVARSLTASGTPFTYEEDSVTYLKEAKYTPDFKLANGVMVEVKGFFKASDRTKMLLIKSQHPELDIRLLFQRASNKLGKGSKTTYGEWATKNGFKWSEKTIPAHWSANCPTNN